MNYFWVSLISISFHFHISCKGQMNWIRVMPVFKTEIWRDFITFYISFLWRNFLLISSFPVMSSIDLTFFSLTKPNMLVSIPVLPALHLVYISSFVQLFQHHCNPIYGVSLCSARPCCKSTERNQVVLDLLWLVSHFLGYFWTPKAFALKMQRIQTASFGEPPTWFQPLVFQGFQISFHVYFCWTLYWNWRMKINKTIHPLRFRGTKFLRHANSIVFGNISISLKFIELSFQAGISTGYLVNIIFTFRATGQRCIFPSQVLRMIRDDVHVRI